MNIINNLLVCIVVGVTPYFTFYTYDIILSSIQKFLYNTNVNKRNCLCRLWSFQHMKIRLPIRSHLFLSLPSDLSEVLV